VVPSGRAARAERSHYVAAMPLTAGPRSGPSTRGRLRLGVAVVVLAVASVVGAACSGSTEPDAAPATTAVDAGAGGGTTSTTAAGPADGGTSSTTGLTVAEHGPLPTVELDEDGRAYVDALLAEPPTYLDGEQADCIASHWVEVVGVDAIRAAGVTPESIEAGSTSINDVPVDRETAEAVVESYAICEFDIVDLVVTGFADLVEGDPTKLACIEAVITPEVAHDYMVAAILSADEGDAPEMEELQRRLEPCVG
jgi:hypothetical protein